MSIATKLIVPESSYRSSRCVFAYHGEQVGGEIENLVQNGPAAVKNAGFTDPELWDARKGWMTFSGVTKFATAPADGTQVTMDGQSLIVTVRIKKTLAAHVAATRYLAQNYTPGQNTGGFLLQVTTGGACGLTVAPVGGSGVNVFAPSGTITNGSVANEVNLVFVASRDGLGRVGNGGVQIGTSTITAAANADLAGGYPLVIGGAAESFELKHLAAYQVPLDLADIPLDLLYDWVDRHPGALIPDWVLGVEA